MTSSDWTTVVAIISEAVVALTAIILSAWASGR